MEKAGTIPPQAASLLGACGYCSDSFLDGNIHLLLSGRLVGDGCLYPLVWQLYPSHARVLKLGPEGSKEILLSERDRDTNRKFQGT